MAKRKAGAPKREIPAVGTWKRTAAGVLPEGAALGGQPRGPYKYRYTTGPFLLPQNAGSLDWTLLNNDSTPQEARVTVFKCPVGAAKAPVPPGPLVVTLGPDRTTHNANTYTAGFAYEVQVECSSQLVFPYVSVWPANFGVVVPGTGIGPGDFVRLMP